MEQGPAAGPVLLQSLQQHGLDVSAKSNKVMSFVK
jgi:hypothetical protein